MTLSPTRIAGGSASAVAELAESSSQGAPWPVCVNLDGALINTDSAYESVLLAVKLHPWLLLLLPYWLLRGKAYLRRRAADYGTPCASVLPYRDVVLQFLRTQKAAGRSLILAADSDERIAAKVADHLGLFDHVIASPAGVHGEGETKLSAIRQFVGRRGFAYLGHSRADLALWQASAEAYLVAPRSELLAQARTVCAPLVLGGPDDAMHVIRSAASALRPHQWVKNLLVLVPLFLAHQMNQLPKTVLALSAFAAFCCCASAIYILNDLLDLEADRRHPTKRRRPFASGRLSPLAGLAISPVLCLIGLGIAAQFVSARFCGLLAAYIALTVAYSLFLKKQMAADVLLLACLYTFRIIAGAVAVDVRLSPWLLAFSLFFFFSLAIGKRYVELRRRTGSEEEELPGRGYCPQDVALLESIGPTSGYMAVLVFCLYIESDAVKAIYDRPWMLWVACPVLLYWLTRFWLLARRSQIHDDPVVFALKDRASLCSIFVTALAVLLAKI